MYPRKFMKATREEMEAYVQAQSTMRKGSRQLERIDSSRCWKKSHENYYKAN